MQCEYCSDEGHLLFEYHIATPKRSNFIVHCFFFHLCRVAWGFHSNQPAASGSKYQVRLSSDCWAESVPPLPAIAGFCPVLIYEYHQILFSSFFLKKIIDTKCVQLNKNIVMIRKIFHISVLTMQVQLISIAF